MHRIRIANKLNTTIQTSRLFLFISYDSNSPWNQLRALLGGVLVTAIDFEKVVKLKSFHYATSRHVALAQL